MKCAHTGCTQEGSWNRVGFCARCWEQLSDDLQRNLLDKRKVGFREEVLAITNASSWLKINAREDV